MRAAVAALALTAFAASAGPAYGHFGFIDVGELRYDPGQVTGVPGEVVTWHWRGPDTNHSVTSDDGLFDSDPGRTAVQIDHAVGDTFSYLFERAGTFTYHCKVHATMTGTVVITDERPDRRPRLTQVRASVAGARAVVRFRVDEPVRVAAQVRRPGSGKVLRKASRFVGRGRGRLAVRLRGLGRGRFVIRVRARDAAGNASRARAVSVRR